MYGDLITIYPKPYSIHLGGTIGDSRGVHASSLRRSSPGNGGEPSNSPNMSYGLNSLKGVYRGFYVTRDIKEDTQSVDYSSYNPNSILSIFLSIPPFPTTRGK